MERDDLDYGEDGGTDHYDPLDHDLNDEGELVHSCLYCGEECPDIRSDYCSGECEWAYEREEADRALYEQQLTLGDELERHERDTAIMDDLLLPPGFSDDV